MSSFIVKVKNTSGTEGTIIADIGFSYTDNLNDINKGQLKISGTGSTKRGLFEIGSEVYIYRNGTLNFHGIINGISFLDAGGISASLLGYESWLSKENGTYSSSPYSSTASATIAGDIIGESNYFTDGTVEAGSTIDFRASDGDSLYNALLRLNERTGQDIGIDYANSEVDILDHKGNSTSVATMNDGIQLRDMVVRQSYPIANWVKVYGQSEGETRIKSTAGCGQDATSQSTYGTITKIYRDSSITTQAEANEIADNLVAKYKDPVKVYEFDVINPNISLESGDVLTLNSQTKGLSNESVRIVSMERGIKNDKELLSLEVTNTAYSKKTKSINKKIAELNYAETIRQTYDSYQSEYSNQNCPSCIGGCAYFTDALACFFGGTCLTGSVVDWLGKGLIGNGVCGCSGDWLYINGSITAPSGTLQGQSLNINVSSANNYICNGLIVDGNVSNSDAPTLGCHLTNKTYVDSVSGGGSSMWADGTNPYVVPCNSCQICVPGISVTGNILDADSTNCLGYGSPGAFKEVNACCGSFTTCAWFGSKGCATILCGTSCVRGDDVCAEDRLVGTTLNINTSSSNNYIADDLYMGGCLDMGSYNIIDVENLYVNDIFDSGQGNVYFGSSVEISWTEALKSDASNLVLCGGASPVVIGGASVAGSSDDLYVVDDFDVGGTKNAVVPYNGCMLAYSAIESPGVWFTDYCSGQICGGKSEICFDDRFVGTTVIDKNNPYIVSLTPTNEKTNIYAKKYNKKAVVKGEEKATFDISITAKRKGYEDLRYRTDEYDEETETWIKPKAKERFINTKEERKQNIYKKFKKKKEELKKLKASKKPNKKLETTKNFINKFKDKKWIKDMEKLEK